MPRITPRRQYIDKYKGMFDDGYEAYREWVLPRMIEQGILPAGTPLTDDEPHARRHLHPDRPGAALGGADRGGKRHVLPDGGGLRRLLGVHGRAGRPDRGLPGGIGPAGQHPHPLLRRQRRLRRGEPERVRQRGQDLRWLSRRPRGPEPDHGGPAGQPRHVQPLSHGLGDGLLDSLPDVQAVHLPGWRVRPARHPLAGRVQRPGARCDRSTTTARTSCRPSSKPAGRDARDLQRRRAESALRRLDGLLLRCPSGRANAEADPVLRDARQPWHLARWLEGRHRPWTRGGHRRLRQRPVAAVPHGRGPVGGA